jgi:galactokinase
MAVEPVDVNIERLRTSFSERFNQRPTVVFAPGRVNLIGDHIDYCGGRVLPMPIAQGTWLALAHNPTGEVHVHSRNADETLVFASAQPETYPPGHWGCFVTGVLAVMGDYLPDSYGLNLLIEGNISGSGLSSSASLCVGLIHGLVTLNQLPLTGIEVALLAQRVEHEHIGVNCGLMDQAAIALGQPEAALLFDCSTNHAEPIPVVSSDVAIIVADTGVRRALSGSQYNERRDCLTRVAQQFDLPFEQLARLLSEQHHLDDPVLAARARHVRTEQERVTHALQCLQTEDWPSLGALFNASHASLARDFQVSCNELDTLADIMRGFGGCYGARMTGGGFGGCVVGLFEPSAINAACPAIALAYKQHTGIDPVVFQAHSKGGVRNVD